MSEKRMKIRGRARSKMLLTAALLVTAATPTVAADELKAVALGAGSILSARMADSYLTQLEAKENFSEKMRLWESKDVELREALKARNRVRAHHHWTHKNFTVHNARSLREIHHSADDFAKAQANFRRLVQEASRKNVSDYTLGEFAGERRRLVDRYYLAKSVGVLGRIGALTALFQNSYIMTSKIMEMSHEEKQVTAPDEVRDRELNAGMILAP